jgi:hypothetical protein
VFVIDVHPASVNLLPLRSDDGGWVLYPLCWLVNRH